ncbi:calmodulin-binding protein 60 A-like isoform X2 [Actinidia eriantha]|uniref:calmodulin-binding protein 60 A-like isoform X2 n=1 Tax=Actinidia eriantha TaxID=165200 RepID=UPI0025901097|nr:calmodulin-binding protein 60 A-like isoform X2 [Actinidia eriantha]
MGDGDSTPIDNSSDEGSTWLELAVLCEIKHVIEPLLETLPPGWLADSHVWPEGNGNSSNGLTTTVSVSKEEVELLVIRIIERVMPLFADRVQEVIKEKIPSVVETIWTRVNQNSEDRVHSSKPRNLELQFQNKPALSVLTGAHIKGEDGSSIKIALIDVVKREVVKSGLEASAKVEILVLRADPDGDEGHVWTPVEFKLNIVTDRKVNLRKKAFVKLKEGMGSIGEIYFPNSRFSMKKCQLRLEARIDGTFNGARVREAKSDTFTLEDYRKTYVKKHDFPSLSDEVWRLKNISRRGQCKKRLHKKNIKTVKDFLKKFFLDREGLQDILGNGMSDKELNETVEHGLKCKLDNRYLYCHPGYQPITGIVFDDVGQVMGRLVESHYVPVAYLAENEKAEAQKLVVSAFEHWRDVSKYDESSSNSLQIPSVSNVGISHSVAGTDDPQPSTAPAPTISASDSIGMRDSRISSEGNFYNRFSE